MADDDGDPMPEPWELAALGDPDVRAALDAALTVTPDQLVSRGSFAGHADEELAEVWRRWWLTVSVNDGAGPVEHADNELVSLQGYLAEHGFVIVPSWSLRS